MRKEAGFEVTDHIRISHQGSDRIEDILNRFGGQVARDTLADEILAGEPAGYVKAWEINGESVTLGVERRV